MAQGCGGEWEGSQRGPRGFRGAARARRRQALSAAPRARGEADRGRLGDLGVRREAVAARPGAADRDDRALGRRALAAVVARDVVPQADGALELGVLGGAAGVACAPRLRRACVLVVLREGHHVVRRCRRPGRARGRGRDAAARRRARNRARREWVRGVAWGPAVEE